MRPVTESPVIDGLKVRACTIPTDAPESDGTLEWDATTVVYVEAMSEGVTGLGWSYCPAVAAGLIEDKLADLVIGRPAFDRGAAFMAMSAAVRNAGSQGIAACAISAVDVALWDLAARLAGLPLADLIGRCRDGIAVYGSGGFTSYSDERLTCQLGSWADAGLGMVKMKVGRDAERDPARVRTARAAIGSDVEIFVDANGAWTAKQALHMARDFAADGVAWLEEPVTSDDIDGLRLVREQGPPGMAVAAGEYGFGPDHFRRLLEAGAIDILQADATRCGGITGFLQTAALADAFHVPLSAHCAPALHLHPCCAVRAAVHMEYFHDHVRIESELLEGTAPLGSGRLTLRDAPGHGLALRYAAAEHFAV
jgi:L-alanine-DL-glutamate epimerase-like enolase superfamily enzyme